MYRRLQILRPTSSAPDCSRSRGQMPRTGRDVTTEQRRSRSTQTQRTVTAPSRQPVLRLSLITSKPRPEGFIPPTPALSLSEPRLKGKHTPDAFAQKRGHGNVANV